MNVSLTGGSRWVVLNPRFRAARSSIFQRALTLLAVLVATIPRIKTHRGPASSTFRLITASSSFVNTVETSGSCPLAGPVSRPPVNHVVRILNTDRSRGPGHAGTVGEVQGQAFDWTNWEGTSRCRCIPQEEARPNAPLSLRHTGNHSGKGDTSRAGRRR
jgi:hypothetical protein